MQIIDASVIIKLCVEEAGSTAARNLFESGRRFATPDHAYAEVAEVLTRKARLGQAVLNQTLAAMQTIAAEIEFLRLEGMISTAMSISMETGASVYDCLYVAAAQRRSCQVLTADTRLINRLAGTPYQPLLLPLASANSPR